MIAAEELAASLKTPKTPPQLAEQASCEMPATPPRPDPPGLPPVRLFASNAAAEADEPSSPTPLLPRRRVLRLYTPGGPNHAQLVHQHRASVAAAESVAVTASVATVASAAASVATTVSVATAASVVVAAAEASSPLAAGATTAATTAAATTAAATTAAATTAGSKRKREDSGVQIDESHSDYTDVWDIVWAQLGDKATKKLCEEIIQTLLSEDMID